MEPHRSPAAARGAGGVGGAGAAGAPLGHEPRPLAARPWRHAAGLAAAGHRGAGAGRRRHEHRHVGFPGRGPQLAGPAGPGARAAARSGRGTAGLRSSGQWPDGRTSGPAAGSGIPGLLGLAARLAGTAPAGDGGPHPRMAGSSPLPHEPQHGPDGRAAGPGCAPARGGCPAGAWPAAGGSSLAGRAAVPCR